VGLVGTGRWAARHHIPGILGHRDATVAGIAEPDSERRTQVAERFGIALALPDHRSLLDVGACDAVVVASPPAAHFEAVADALDVGLPVLVEKPLTPHPDQAWELVRRARDASLHLMVGYTFEVTPTARAVRRWLAGGKLGDPLLISGTYASSMRHLFTGDPPPGATSPLDRPKPETFNSSTAAGGGQAYSQLTHLVASVLNATGLEPRAVLALLRPDGHHDLHDAVIIDFGQAVATLSSTCVLPTSHPPVWQARYFYSQGTLEHDLLTGAAVVRTQDETTTIGPLDEPERYPASAVVERFIDLVLGRGANPAPGELGAWCTAVVHAAARSALNDGLRQPVSAPSVAGAGWDQFRRLASPGWDQGCGRKG
jgi:predicted dehydrogenase